MTPPLPTRVSLSDMAIYRLMREQGFKPEVTARIALAYEMAARRIGLYDRTDTLAEQVATKIIEIAKTGEQSPSVVCERALKELRARH